jgi:hypothetical protein
MQETDVAKRYCIDRGTVQVIQQLISIVSHMVCILAQMRALYFCRLFERTAAPLR